jgi:hypothetical protein
MLHDPTVLPDDLPAPQDDGAARHLMGAKLPDIALPATARGPILRSSRAGPSSISTPAPGGRGRRSRPGGTEYPVRAVARRSPARSAITLPS